MARSIVDAISIVVSRSSLMVQLDYCICKGGRLMRRLMSNGRVPKRSIPVAGNIDRELMSGDRARTLILSHRAPDGMRVLGHLDLGEEDDIYHLPENLICESLDISDCRNITTLPKGLQVTNWIEIAGSGITSLPEGHGFCLRWRGVHVSDRYAFRASSSG